MSSAPAAGIGVLGSAFNPPPLGHLALAQEALWQLGLAEVLLAPVGEAPHKRIADDPGRELRLAMTRLAAADDPRFRYEIEFPPALERGLGRLAKAAVDVPKSEPVVQMVRRNLRRMTGAEPEHFGVRLPQSYAGNDTTHLWAAGIPCCIYGPGGGYTDYHDVHVELADLFLCTRVLALTALEAAL